jgi:hypothetical protein
MDGPSPGFPYRWFLPVIQLLVCILVLQPYWFRLRTEVWRSIQGWEQSLLGNDESRPQPAIVLNATPDLPAPPEPVDIRLTAPAALNLPVGFVQVPFVLFSPDKTEWAPEGMLLEEWRGLSWPFLGLVFWWVAGRGLEAFFAAAGRRRFAIIRPPLHWIEVTVGLCLFVMGSVAGLMYAFGRNPFVLMRDWVFAAGAGLWAVLGAVIVVARLLQWRLRRLARIQGIAYVP